MSEPQVTKTVPNKIRQETISHFNESKTVSIKVLKTDLKTETKGSKCKDCAGCGIHCVDHRKNVWSKLLFHGSTKALKAAAEQDDELSDENLPDDVEDLHRSCCLLSHSRGSYQDDV
jgi:hypothetical protein